MFMNKKNTQNDKKKEIADIIPFDIFKLLGLRPKKIDAKYKKYASLNRRIIAAAIDSTIASFSLQPFIVWFLQTFYHLREIEPAELGEVLGNEKTGFSHLMKLLIESGKIYEFGLEIALYISISAICWKLWSATPGKILLRIKIVDAKTEKHISSRQITYRALGYIVSCSFFFLGIFWIGLNKRRQGWHDLIAGTVVIINSRQEEKIIDDGAEGYIDKSIEVSAAVS